MAGNRFGGRRIGIPAVLDAWSRVCLSLVSGQSVKGEDVARALAAIRTQRGDPVAIRGDICGEFGCLALDRWAYENGVVLEFSGLGKPRDNALCESI